MEVVALLSQGRTAAAQCGLFTHKSVPVIFEPPCIYCVGSKVPIYLKQTSLLCVVIIQIINLTPFVLERQKSACYMLRVQTSLTQTQGLSTNLVIYKTVIDLLRLVVTELSKLQAYRPFGAGGGAVWLRLCAKRRKVAGSIFDGVTRIFHWLWG